MTGICVASGIARLAQLFSHAAVAFLGMGDIAIKQFLQSLRGEQFLGKMTQDHAVELVHAYAAT